MGGMKCPAPLRPLALGLTLGALLALPHPAAPQESPAATAAQGPVYNVEIIVFRALAPLGGAENWGAEAGEHIVAGDESASGTAQVGHFVALLPASAWQLTELESRLRASGTYQPVGHAAWSQTASSWG